MTQDVRTSSIDVSSTVPNFRNDVYGQSLSMAAPLIQGGFTNAAIPTFANDAYGQPSAMYAPFIQGEYTSLLLGVHQDATLSSSAKKLHFDE